MKKLIILFALLTALVTVSAAEPNAKEPAKPVELSNATFIDKVFDYRKNPENWTYKGDKPAIVDFYAHWCGPCRITSPILSELAEEYGDEIYIYKIDVDKEKELAGLFGVQSIPMFLFIPMNENPATAKGALPKDKFREVIDSFLLKKEEGNKK